MKVLAVVISGLFLSAPALAQASDTPEGQNEHSSTARTDQSTEQPRTEAEEAEGGERRICRRVGDRTASLTAGRRVCMTAQQWRNSRRD
jgi:hypothetical protein